MPIAQFTAFYPSRPFWAVSKIDFEDSSNLNKFEDLMAEEVYEKSDPAFTLKICRDGMIMLRIEELEKDDVSPAAEPQASLRKWGVYLDYLNSLYLLLDSATLRVMNLALFNLHEITSKDAFRVRYESGKTTGFNMASESFAAMFQMGRFRSTYGLPIPHDPRLSTRQIIPLQVIETATEEFTLVVRNPGLEKVLAAFTKSLGEYKVGNYEMAIILAWFISETAINKMWATHLSSLNTNAGAEERISANRKKILTGRDFPISVIANTLELSGVLPFSLFRGIDLARRSRNKIVHGEPGYAPTDKEAQSAISTALELSKNLYSIDFTPNLSYSLVGL